MFYSVRCCLTGLSMPLELSERGNLKHPQCITLSLRSTTCDLFICVNHVLYNMTLQSHFGEIKHEHALLYNIKYFWALRGILFFFMFLRYDELNYPWVKETRCVHNPAEKAILACSFSCYWEIQSTMHSAESAPFKS